MREHAHSKCHGNSWRGGAVPAVRTGYTSIHLERLERFFKVSGTAAGDLRTGQDSGRPAALLAGLRSAFDAPRELPSRNALWKALSDRTNADRTTRVTAQLIRRVTSRAKTSLKNSSRMVKNLSQSRIFPPISTDKRPLSSQHARNNKTWGRGIGRLSKTISVRRRVSPEPRLSFPEAQSSGCLTSLQSLGNYQISGKPVTSVTKAAGANYQSRRRSCQALTAYTKGA